MSGIVSLPVTVEKAVEADIPALAEINTLAYYPEPISAFFFSDWPNPTPFNTFFTARAAHNVRDPSTDVFKIADASTSEILGFVCLQLVKGDGRGGKTNPAGDFEPPPGLAVNAEFMIHCAKGQVALEECVKGKKHYVLTSFAVPPRHQRRGLGSRLLRYCTDVADAAGLPIYLNDFPNAHQLYLKFGFAEVGEFAIDLNEWGPRDRGYGVYRSYGMLREPL